MPVLKELRILPPIAIARFGSSSQPMDNYTAQIDEENVIGFRELIPAETLVVNRETGEITSAVVPPKPVKFRDADGLIKPVCPFFEVWARFDDNDFLEPLTAAHLTYLQSSAEQIRWRVRVGNHKIFRRTGIANDKIEADSGAFSDHVVHTLVGRANNFKTGKTIKLGSVQYIKPTDAFPEIKLRFTPAEGKVYGHRVNDPNTSDDVYDSTVGLWDTHNDGDASLPTGTPLPTSPARIYARSRPPGARLNLGYLDDSCDGIIEVELMVNDQKFSASARATVGPPDFAPDSFHLRTVADEIEQMLLGLKVNEKITFEQATDLMRRALETMRLMNSDVWNSAYPIKNDDNIFPPERARYALVRGFHERTLLELQGLKPGASSQERAAAIGALGLMRSILRSYEQAVDLTTGTLQMMPPMMRGSDGFNLAVNRRQLSILEKAIADFSSEEPQPPLEPEVTNPAEADLLRIITELSIHANRHTRFNTPDGRRLSDLFSDPPAVLEYLKTSNASGVLAGPLAGQPLVVPGNADASAFPALLERPGHPMRIPFQQVDATTQKKRIDIVRDWINALPV
ncbi:MAG TPA: hypothetical protein VK400_01010 [Pyrinomonadaceae bacterium]|nr:hypothetical protein [Pyrinomonadaceae bacterium]